MDQTKPIRKPGFAVKAIGNEMLLHSIDNEVIHVLNPTAHLIWDLCDGEHTPEDMIREVREKFTVPAGRDVSADIQKTLTLFSDKGLLR